MNNVTENAAQQITNLLVNIADLLPGYLANEEDMAKGNGNVAVCIIDTKGNVYGKIFGDDKIRGREAYRVAWMKASQAWITGIKTGEFEKLAFTNEIDDKKFGIRRPDFIGWEGGQPLQLKSGLIIAAGVSGMTSGSDLEIVTKACSL